MKFASCLTLLGACALFFASCDKPKPVVAVPPPGPPPGADGKFSDPPATQFLEQFKAFAAKAADALKAGDPKKYPPLVAAGQTLAVQARAYEGRIKAEEMPEFQKQMAEYTKLLEEMIKNGRPNAGEKIKAALAARAAAAEAAKNAPPVVPVQPAPAVVAPAPAETPTPTPPPAAPVEPAPVPTPDTTPK